MPGKDERPISRSQLAKRNEQFLSSKRPKGGYRVYTPPDSLGRSDQALPLNWLDMNLPIIFSPFAQGSAEMFCIVQHVTHLGRIIFMRLTQPRNRAGIFYAQEIGLAILSSHRSRRSEARNGPKRLVIQPTRSSMQWRGEKADADHEQGDAAGHDQQV